MKDKDLPIVTSDIFAPDKSESNKRQLGNIKIIYPVENIAVNDNLRKIDEPNGILIALYESSNFTLGRSINNSVTINNSSVSRHHISISTDSENIYVSDLGSLNGSKINCRQMKGLEKIQADSEINVGNVICQITLSDVPKENLNFEGTIFFKTQEQIKAVIFVFKLHNIKHSHQLENWLKKFKALRCFEFEKFTGDSLFIFTRISDEINAFNFERFTDLVKITSAQFDSAISCGISMGEMYLTGDNFRGFNLIGNSVNTAFRLADKAFENKCLALVSKEIELNLEYPLTTVSLKGITDNYEAWTILALNL